jgi:hypothetical protein
MGRLCYPTQASGHDPDTLARKLSRRAPREQSEQRGCKGGFGAVFGIQVQILWGLRVSRYKFDRSREFIPGYKVGGGHWRRVAVQTITKPEIYHGAGF